MARSVHDAAGANEAGTQRLYAYTGGLLRPGRVRRILTLAGYDIRLGLPGPDDLVAVWGRSPRARRGEVVAARRGAGLLRVEDAFLRSVLPGRGGKPIGLLADRRGVHYAAAEPSDLEHLLATDPLDDTALLDRARDGMARMAMAQLSKYNAHDPERMAPAPGYVLVADQLRGDASIRHGGVDQGAFRDMLVTARSEHPGARVVVRGHPAAHTGRPGHFGPSDLAAVGGDVVLADPAVSPHALLDGAVAVYTVSSQFGFDAILAGHRPRVFGQPFYAGWGLTEDARPLPRRRRLLTRPQLFAAAMILAPLWYDPCRDRLCDFETALDQIEAEVRTWRADRHGHVASGIRLWKRGFVRRFFGGSGRIDFADDPDAAAAKATARGVPLMVWAGRETPNHAAAPAVLRLEDGFMRSRGLGAALVPPLSLVCDDLGIYYDPTRESRLERMIASPPPPGGARRAERLIARLVRLGVTKYTPDHRGLPDLPEPPPGAVRILVPGQVEDDASIRLGAGDVRDNLALLARTRAENPDAVILYKPHPDVEAGLRAGVLDDAAVRAHADMVICGADPAAIIDAVDEVWTMTSLMGFEALLRGRAVTCLGAPFYAGWGLTRDLGPVPARRQARPELAEFVHAALIAYPRYRDPVSGLPCPAEVVVDRLAAGRVAHPGPALRLLSKAQGLLASRSRLWR